MCSGRMGWGGGEHWDQKINGLTEATRSAFYMLTSNFFPKHNVQWASLLSDISHESSFESLSFKHFNETGATPLPMLYVPLSDILYN